MLKNFSHLALHQGVNLITPLITYPYIIRILGPENYGTIAYAQAIIGYFLILVMFGFNFSATKIISQQRNSHNKVSSVFNGVITIKLGLFGFSALLTLLYGHLFIDEKTTRLILYLSLWMCLNDIVIPVWYFQGVEKMHHISIATLISRMVYVLLIFWLVKIEDDLYLIPISNLAGIVLAGAYSFFIILNIHQIKIKPPNTDGIRNLIHDSIPIFFSNLSTGIFVNANKIVVGQYFGMTEVAYMDLAEKIANLVKMPIQILGQAIYPRVVTAKNNTILRNYAAKILKIAAILFTFSIINGANIIEVLGGAEMAPSTKIFNILAVSTLPVAISIIFSNLTLLPNGKNREFLIIRLLGISLYAILITTMIFWQNISLIKMALILLAVESFTAILSFYFATKLGLSFVNRTK